MLYSDKMLQKLTSEFSLHLTRNQDSTKNLFMQ